MKNLIEYINNLNFEYAISYSGLRGAAFESRAPSPSNALQATEETNIYKARIINKFGNLHQSAKAIHKFDKGDQTLLQIFEVLSIKYKKHDKWMCPPVFRDAIVFYTENHEISGILHLCFSCEMVKNELDEKINVDYKIYPKLKSILIRLGHEIEDD